MKRTIETRFFHFSQNNTGGTWSGPAHHVIIEAANPEEANRIAEEDVGLYFNGCASGMDCECCGDRWSELWESEKGDAEPLVYGTKPQELAQRDSWIREFAFIRYYDGTTELIEAPNARGKLK